jgi:cysteine desulfurase
LNFKNGGASDIIYGLSNCIGKGAGATVYLDNAATTPVCLSAERELLRVTREVFGNPSSLHSLGFEAERELEAAREIIAGTLDCAPDEIYFTPSGTFADNLALLGVHRGRGRHIITSLAEHDAVLNSARRLQKEGFEVTFLAPGPSGAVSVEDVERALTPDTALVSLMLANNETGAVNDIAEIAKIVKKKAPGAVLHTDAVQAYMKMPISVRSLKVDFLSVSGHKIHAPKGIGALYMRKGCACEPLIYGGGQERRLSPGTENVAGAVAFAAAAEEGLRELSAFRTHSAELKKRLTELLGSLPVKVYDFGGLNSVMTLSAPGWKSETLIHALAEREVYVSSGSACSKGRASRVLIACGLPREEVDSALRISFSRFTTAEDIEIFAHELGVCLEKLARKR